MVGMVIREELMVMVSWEVFMGSMVRKGVIRGSERSSCGMVVMWV